MCSQRIIQDADAIVLLRAMQRLWSMEPASPLRLLYELPGETSVGAVRPDGQVCPSRPPGAVPCALALAHQSGCQEVACSFLAPHLSMLWGFTQMLPVRPLALGLAGPVQVERQEVVMDCRYVFQNPGSAPQSPSFSRWRLSRE